MYIVFLDGEGAIFLVGFLDVEKLKDVAEIIHVITI